MKQGKLIVIEGIDGSGKSTQFKMLLARLKEEGGVVQNIKFPRHQTPFFGNMVDDYLNGTFGDPTKLHPKIASLIFACDRWEVKDKLLSWLQKGNTVLLDRYLTSNKGHQLGKITDEKQRLELLNWLDEMEYNTFQIPKPDLVIYLNVSMNHVQRMLESRPDEGKEYTDKKDLHEQNLDHLKQSQNAYQFTTKQYDYWKQIDCTEKDILLSIEEIHEKIWHQVKNIL